MHLVRMDLSRKLRVSDVIVVLLTLFSTAVSSWSASIKRTFLKSGFHRDLSTEIRLTGLSSTSPCHLLMKEVLPSGAYVDLFQLKQMYEFGGPRVWTSNTIDIEKPEYLSEPLELHIYPNISIKGVNSVTITVLLPVHLRYHRPSTDLKEYVTVQFSRPELYIHCQGENISGSQISAACDDSNSVMCSWSEVTLIGMVDPLSLEVPVGQTAHTELVVVGTFIAVFATCFWLIWTMLSINHPIEEHCKVS